MRAAVFHGPRDLRVGATDILAARSLGSVVIERVIGLDDLVPLGIRPLLERTAKGKIVVDPGRPS